MYKAIFLKTSDLEDLVKKVNAEGGSQLLWFIDDDGCINATYWVDKKPSAPTETTEAD